MKHTNLRLRTRTCLKKYRVIVAAARWDTTDQHIRANRDAGQPDISVRPLPPYLGENFVGPDPKNYFNVCVARYYGVRSIVAADASS